MNYLHFFKKLAIALTFVGGVSATVPAHAEGAQGKVLVYWASWCGYCKSALQQFEDLSQAQALAGNRVVAVNIHDKGVNPQRYLRELNLDLKAAKAIDYSMASKQVPGLPWVVLVDAQGEVIASTKAMKSAAATREWVASMTELHRALAQFSPKAPATQS